MSATLGSGTITVEAAFGDAPLTATASNTWTDITAYVMECSTNRGRSHSLDAVQPGTCTIKLDNSDRRFDPLHSAGAYYGDLLPNVKVRISYTYNAVTYRVFTGYVNGWPQDYDAGNTHATCTVTAVDAFKLLSLHQLDESMFTSWLKSLSPTHWYRLNESTGATRISDDGSTALPASVNKAPNFGTASLDAGSASTATSFRAPSNLVPDCLTIPDVVDGWTCLSFLFRIPSELPSDWGALGGYPWSNSDLTVWLDADVNGNVQITAFDWTEGIQNVDVTAASSNHMHHVMVKRNSGAAATIYLDGSLLSSSTSGAATTIADSETWIGGQSDSVDGSLRLGARIQHVATFGTDVTGRADELYDAALDGHEGDTTGARLGRILDIVGWASADRDVDTGVTSLGAASPNGASALAYLQTLERTEQGLMFVAGDGDITFIDRDQLRTATRHTTSQTTFSDDGSDDPYLAGSLSFDYDDEQIRNEVYVTGDGIEQQRAIDTTSVTSYGQRSESVSTYIADERVARNLAEYRVIRRKDPSTRPTQFSVRPERDAATIYPTTLDLDIGDRITIQRTPQGTGSQISVECHVDSLGWTFTPGDVVLTVSASPVDDTSWFTWGTSNWDGSDGWSY